MRIRKENIMYARRNDDNLRIHDKERMLASYNNVLYICDVL